MHIKHALGLAISTSLIAFTSSALASNQVTGFQTGSAYVMSLFDVIEGPAVESTGQFTPDTESSYVQSLFEITETPNTSGDSSWNLEDSSDYIQSLFEL